MISDLFDHLLIHFWHLFFCGNLPICSREESSDISKKVYVGGIPYYSTEDDIRSYFDGCGTITEVDCMSFPDSRKFRGIAIITFKVDSSGELCLLIVFVGVLSTIFTDCCLNVLDIFVTCSSVTKFWSMWLSTDFSGLRILICWTVHLINIEIESIPWENSSLSNMTFSEFLSVAWRHTELYFW